MLFAEDFISNNTSQNMEEYEIDLDDAQLGFRNACENEKLCLLSMLFHKRAMTNVRMFLLAL